MANNQPAGQHALQQSTRPVGGQSITTNVRRHNLFASNISRRPTYNTSAAAPTTAIHSSHHLHGHHNHHSAAGAAGGSRSDNMIDRDEHGIPIFQYIPIAPMPPDEEREKMDEEARLIAAYKKWHAYKVQVQQDREGGVGGADAAKRPGPENSNWTAADSEFWPLSAGMDEEEVAKMEKKMKDALQSYLNRAVNSLDDDAWMFDDDDAYAT